MFDKMPKISLYCYWFDWTFHIFNFCVNQSSHENEKGNSPFYYIKIILNRMSYIHFLSKIFFMIKWTSGFFIFVWRNVWFLDTHFSGESYDIMSICWTDLLSFGFCSFMFDIRGKWILKLLLLVLIENCCLSKIQANYSIMLGTMPTQKFLLRNVREILHTC